MSDLYEVKYVETLQKLIKQNSGFDYLYSDLSLASSLENINWKGFTKNRETLVVLLKAYQRLIRIIPEGETDIAFALLELQIHSAVQIASMTKKQFSITCAAIFKGKSELLDTVYKNAECKKSRILHRYMNVLQNNEPHVKAAGI